MLNLCTKNLIGVLPRPFGEEGMIFEYRGSFSIIVIIKEDYTMTIQVPSIPRAESFPFEDGYILLSHLIELQKHNKPIVMVNAIFFIFSNKNSCDFGYEYDNPKEAQSKFFQRKTAFIFTTLTTTNFPVPEIITNQESITLKWNYLRVVLNQSSIALQNRKNNKIFDLEEEGIVDLISKKL